ncbi:MAG: EamA family transporter [Ginsengibacter sp.]
MQKYFSGQYYLQKRQNASTRTKAYLALTIVSITWGTTWLASKEAVRLMPPLQMISFRQFSAGCLLLLFFLFKKQPMPLGKQWKSIFILSVLNFLLSNGLSTWGVKYISSGLGSIISAIFPLWLVIILLFKGSKIPTNAIIGMVLGFGGVCIIFYEHLNDFLNADFRLGIIMSITASITWAFGTLYTQKHAINFNPYVSLGFQMFISGGVLLIAAYSTGNVMPLKDIPVLAWSAIAYLVIISSLITYVAYIYTLQHLPATLASIYAYINPIIAILLGALLVNEPFTWFIAIGGLVTIAGVYLMNRSLRGSIAKA